MDEQEAVEWVRLGVTPRWVEGMRKEGYDFFRMAEQVWMQTGRPTQHKELLMLAEYWGIS